MSEHDLPNLVRKLASEAKAASRVLARAGTEEKNAVLRRVATALRGPERALVLEANERDLAVAQDLNLSAAVADRLRLDPNRLAALASGIETVMQLPDPVGELVQMRPLDSGIRAGRMCIPLGVIALIYESRPHVTADAAALAIKSGNACVLRGGKEAFHSCQALARLFEDALAAEHLPRAAITLLPTTQREAALALLRLDDLIDVVIPRGSEELVRFVTENARMPVLSHGQGLCHIYVDGGADYDQAERILLDAKVRQPSVCNAVETLLVARDAAEAHLPRLCAALAGHGVSLRACPEARVLYPAAKLAPPPDYDAAYLDLILNVRVVEDLDVALAHIAAHGSRHTEVIVTNDLAHSRRFVREVDASAVMVNTSPRFNDGGQLGLGTELGVSTAKLHAYGPMGLAELCTKKWIVYGDGHIRG